MMATCKKCGIELTDENKCECGEECCKGCGEDKTCCSEEVTDETDQDSEETDKTE